MDNQPIKQEISEYFYMLFQPQRHMPTQFITRADIHQFLKIGIAKETNTTPDRIDINTHLAAYRLNPFMTVTLAVNLGDWLNATVEPSIFWEFANIADLTTWLLDDYLPDGDYN